MSDAAIQLLTEQVAELIQRMDRANSAIIDLRLEVSNLSNNASRSAAPAPPARTSGYVNWSDSHDVIKTQLWVKLSLIKENITYMESLWNFGTGKETLRWLHKSKDAVSINENKRFPQDGAYVNIYSQRVSAELTLLQAQVQRGIGGHMDRFNANCVNEAHTFSSFEEKYKLRWV